MDEREEIDDFMTNPNHLLRQEVAAMHHDWTPGSSPSMSPHEIHEALEHEEHFSPELYVDELSFSSDSENDTESENFEPAEVFQHQDMGALPPICSVVPSQSSQCAVCLEALREGQRGRRTPCLHTFHDACLSEWCRRSATCPVCTLDLKSPTRLLRYRLSDLAALTLSEIEHLVHYLEVGGSGRSPSAQRGTLEKLILSSKHVRIVSHRQELMSLSAKRLKDLLTCVGVKDHEELVEHEQKVDALLASERFVQETVTEIDGPDGRDSSCSTEVPTREGSSSVPFDASSAGVCSSCEVMDAAVSDMQAALEASMQEANERAVAINGPLSSAILHSRLVPEHVVLLDVNRTLSSLRSALLEGPELAEIRGALERRGHAVETPCGAKVFVRPEQYKGVLDTIQTMGLKPRHIIVSLEFESLVTGVIDGVKRTSVKRRRITKTHPVYSEEPAVAVDVKRTFIHLDIPSSLRSGPSASRPATC
jgi:hypothetical protein